MSRLNIDWNLAHMNKIIRYIFFFSALCFLSNCSFDKKSGIWSGNEEEIKRITKLEEENRAVKHDIFSTSDDFAKEISAIKVVSLSSPIKNSSWPMSGLNLQNSLGNLYLESIQHKFVKKKVGWNKFNISQKMHSPLFFQNNIVLSDSNGSIFKISKKAKLFGGLTFIKKFIKNCIKI